MDPHNINFSRKSDPFIYQSSGVARASGVAGGGQEGACAPGATLGGR